MRGRWPNPDSRPQRGLRRHLARVHGLTLTGEETAVDCDEAEGWASSHHWDPSCGQFAVNRGKVSVA